MRLQPLIEVESTGDSIGDSEYDEDYSDNGESCQRLLHWKIIQ